MDDFIEQVKGEDALTVHDSGTVRDVNLANVILRSPLGMRKKAMILRQWKSRRRAATSIQNQTLGKS